MAHVDPDIIAFVKGLNPKVTKEKFRVFLFGPSLTDGESVPEPAAGATIESQAKFLRHFLLEKLKEKNWQIDLGESDDIIRSWTKLDETIDPGNMEYHHALYACGAIVILPSSPGSFCEIGLFATTKEISRKTLAIVHVEFKKSKSFFRRGLVRIFQQRAGKCTYESYYEKEAILEAAEEFIEDRFNSYHWDHHDIRQGEKRTREQTGTDGAY